MKTLNPWLRSNSLTNSARKKYIIEFPRKGTKVIDIENETTLPVVKNTDSLIIPIQRDSIKESN
jgi:hypothetical protein